MKYTSFSIVPSLIALAVTLPVALTGAPALAQNAHNRVILPQDIRATREPAANKWRVQVRPGLMLNGTPAADVSTVVQLRVAERAIGTRSFALAVPSNPNSEPCQPNSSGQCEGDCGSEEGGHCIFSGITNRCACITFPWAEPWADFAEVSAQPGDLLTVEIVPAAGAVPEVYTDDNFASVSIPSPIDYDGNGAIDITDLIAFLVGFEVGDIAADLDDGGGAGGRDSAVDVSDLLFFLLRFEQGG